MLQVSWEHDSAGRVAVCLDSLLSSSMVGHRCRIEARRHEHIGTLLGQVMHQITRSPDVWKSFMLDSAYTVGDSWTRRTVHSRQGMTEMIQHGEQQLQR